MRDKQKVTLYIPPELHRKLKIKAAVDAEPMSAIAERALVFYLTHPDAVDEVESLQGQAHKIYSCPECESSLLLKDGDVVALSEQPGILSDDDLDVSSRLEGASRPEPEQHDREELVPC